MKRMHLHISVQDLAQSIRFYSTLFGVSPSVEKPDYAKWMLDDPRVNFAISQRGAPVGLDHVGIQVDNENDLAVMKARIDAAGMTVLSQSGAVCCYAKSNKHWVQDPSGVAWETYHTLDSAPTFNANHSDDAGDNSCCAPAAQAIQFNTKREKRQHDGKPNCG